LPWLSLIVTDCVFRASIAANLEGVAENLHKKFTTRGEAVAWFNGKLNTGEVVQVSIQRETLGAEHAILEEEGLDD
jgi:hypothetical protein